ncbi:hypothetical protein [Flavobacterium marginilacus]|uniref:hypothetical protein n=1 Tax=Flavobacterium marginilacus TaxID=3003256 RepID=UPI00248F22EF|nr:hypothetical protein [Flavobacterium marginilacus]
MYWNCTIDLDDPSREIGRLAEPLLAPLEEKREGYVPNVVYSCGSIIHNNSLILPYAVSDYSSTYAVVDMTELLEALLNSKNNSIWSYLRLSLYTIFMVS